MRRVLEGLRGGLCFDEMRRSGPGANPEAAGVIEAVAVNPTQRSPARPFILRFFPSYKLRHLELSPVFKWMDQSSVPTGYPALSGLQQAQTTAVIAIRLRLSPRFEEVCEKFLPRLSWPGLDSPCCRAAERTRRLQGSDDLQLSDEEGDSRVMAVRALQPDTVWGPFPGILQSEGSTEEQSTEASDSSLGLTKVFTLASTHRKVQIPTRPEPVQMEITAPIRSFSPSASSSSSPSPPQTSACLLSPHGAILLDNKPQ
ncbi:hypothetical protein CRENBAI_005862 [Crenichthys baileyi]|uniref:Zinc finger protein ZFPM1/2 PR domain-containing protein n=1 Tax=Crenichthys baileyi TaxID=28760 RepID=A0AAV9S1G9_9TELE